MRGQNLLVSLGNRKVSQHALNDRVRNLLTLANKVAPLASEGNASEDVNNTSEARALMRELAVAGIVLLKNDDSVLPLDKSKSVAVIGPNAKIAAYAGGGSASLRPTYTTTPYEGIAQHAKDLKYTLGAHGYKQLPAISLMSTREDGEPGMTCRFFNEPPSEDPGGRICRDVVQTDLSDMLLVDYSHPDIRQDVWYMDMSGTITPAESGEYQFGCSVRGTAKVFVDGELVVDNATAQRQGATFMGAGTLEERGTKTLEAGRTYAVLLQFGSSPTQKIRKVGATAMRGGGVRLGCTKVIDADEEIAKAVALAKEVEQVVICAGLTAEWESEGFDRADMALPGRTNDLIRAVSTANPRTAVVVQSGTPVEMPWAAAVPALVQAPYGGNEGGRALGDVLFGAAGAAPSGKLVYTIPGARRGQPGLPQLRV
ncbi:hypothetical protein PG997_000062 [Apiospora hydei]|uniref:Probable beta-glucosidase I n=1 Tax=Apiospora hydei TaxID=1337664 RepID=A0ABR1X9X6_9PEZI